MRDTANRRERIQRSDGPGVAPRAQARLRSSAWRAVATGALAVAGVAVAYYALAARLEGGRPASMGSYVAATIAGLAFVSVKRTPIVALGVIVAAQLLIAVDTGEEAVVPLAIATLYIVAREGQRRERLEIAVSAALVMSISVGLFGEGPFWQTVPRDAVWMLLPVAIADARRSREERLRELIDSEATERVTAERLRIARDLHDVVAHGLSMIAIQSGVAARLIDRDTDQARVALNAINTVSKDSLTELRGMLGVLRSTDTDLAPLDPAPSDPDDVSDLVRTAAQSGLHVTVNVTGRFPAETSDAAVIAVHRILQEAITNVARHAGRVATRVAITHHADDVTVEVDNDPGVNPNRSIPSTGVGITGMTERAQMLGGTLTTCVTPLGGFNVTATVPYQPIHQ